MHKDNQLEKEREKLIKSKMHPWHGKTMKERKSYIEKLLIEFKQDQMKQEDEVNRVAL